MGTGQRVRIELRAGPYGERELVVRRVRGREALSTPFRFEVEAVTVSGEALDLAELVGKQACLTLRRPSGVARTLQGLCTSADHGGVRDGVPWYAITLAPRLALLGIGLRSRVFQNLSAVEVVGKVLGDHGLRCARRLSEAYPKREMCIQYRESDLAFASRLLADEGITYWVGDEDGEEAVVLGDAPGAFEVLPFGEELPFRTGEDPLDEEYLFDVRQVLASRASRTTTRDRDFERPDLVIEASRGAAGGPEVYEHPSGRIDPDHNNALAGRRLERLRVEAELFEGAGTCIRLGAGRILSVVEHPDAGFARRLLAISVEHAVDVQDTPGSIEGVEAEHRVRFRAIPAEQPYRPTRTWRALVPGPQTATVVGPSQEEVHADRHGRVKVQFHWDREGRRDERSSAWVRLAQAWAGAGFGAQFTPRVGHEVLVRFLEGDPDRPVVTGAVYNGANLTPVALPQDKTCSTLRTATSPGGEGANELRFEDRTGAEQVYLHAQRDESVVVRADKVQRVRGSEALTVERDRTLRVGGDQQLRVGGDDGGKVAGVQRIAVARDRETRVGQGQREQIAASQAVTVSGSRRVDVAATSTESVGAAAALTIGAAYQLGVLGAQNVLVGGVLTRQVGGAYHQVVGAGWSEQVTGGGRRHVGAMDVTDVSGSVSQSAGGDRTEKVGGDAALSVEGRCHVQAEGVELVANAFALVVAGKKVLSIDRGGNVVLAGTSVTVEGTAVRLAGASIAKLGPAPPPAAHVQLASPQDLDRAPSLAQLTLVDHTGEPVPHEPFELLFGDGSRWTGTTDAEGRVRAPAPAKGEFRVTFPRHAR